MDRVYESMIRDHFQRNEQMLLVSGARQVGKTTVGKAVGEVERFHYLNWDLQEDRLAILGGQRSLSANLGSEPHQTIVFDELHKYADWKNFLKGFYDVYHELKWDILATGSARLDTFRKGGDSLLGRYFHLQMFPLSVAELLWTDFDEQLIRAPRELSDDLWQSLLRFGGFPEPLLKSNARFHRQWTRSRQDLLFQEDIRTLGKGFDVLKIELLAELVVLNAGSLLNYSSLAKIIRASVESIQRWLTLLEQLSFCFRLRPWTKNISRSIAKEPKLFLNDWSSLSDVGKRSENFVANALMKAVEGWNDMGLGEFGLYFIRTKEKREVDFVVTRESEPWFLVEVKTSDTHLSPQLEYFQKLIKASHAFQVVVELPYQDVDCFSVGKPVVVPAKTFLSQLL
jgi:predicted AAA+ superfamily ATPase